VEVDAYYSKACDSRTDLAVPAAAQNKGEEQGQGPSKGAGELGEEDRGGQGEEEAGNEVHVGRGCVLAAGGKGLRRRKAASASKKTSSSPLQQGGGRTAAEARTLDAAVLLEVAGRDHEQRRTKRPNVEAKETYIGPQASQSCEGKERPNETAKRAGGGGEGGGGGGGGGRGLGRDYGAGGRKETRGVEVDAYYSKAWQEGGTLKHAAHLDEAGRLALEAKIESIVGKTLKLDARGAQQGRALVASLAHR